MDEFSMAPLNDVFVKLCVDVSVAVVEKSGFTDGEVLLPIRAVMSKLASASLNVCESTFVLVVACERVAVMTTVALVIVPVAFWSESMRTLG